MLKSSLVRQKRFQESSECGNAQRARAGFIPQTRRLLGMRATHCSTRSCELERLKRFDASREGLVATCLSYIHFRLFMLSTYAGGPSLNLDSQVTRQTRYLFGHRDTTTTTGGDNVFGVKPGLYFCAAPMA